MIGQPGEETSEGAKAMLDDGLFTRFPKPDYVIAFHDAAVLPAGVVGITPGYALANVDSVDITVRGVGGHGAVPQNTRDPIVLAARIVGTLQTLVSRENDPQSPAVVTVGSFHGGAKHNIISDEAKLQLTVRSYTPETRKLLLDGIRRIARGEAIAAGMPDDKMPVVTIREAEYTPATFNTETLTERAPRPVHRAFRRRPGGISPSRRWSARISAAIWLADKSKESLLIWVGGTPQGPMGQGRRRHQQAALAPLARSGRPTREAVIGTATEAHDAARDRISSRRQLRRRRIPSLSRRWSARAAARRRCGSARRRRASGGARRDRSRQAGSRRSGSAPPAPSGSSRSARLRSRSITLRRAASGSASASCRPIIQVIFNASSQASECTLLLVA